MWGRKKKKKNSFLRFNRSEDAPVKRKFKLKYIRLITTFVGINLILVLAPVTYFFIENYEIFIQLAYKTAPELVDHLHQEKKWLWGYLFVAFITSLIFSATFVNHFSNRIVGPVLVLRSHLRTLIQGQWSVEKLKIRHDDEFPELVQTYNSLYRQLQESTRLEIENLKSLSIPEDNLFAKNLCEKMIEQKIKKLNLQGSSEDALNSGPSHDSLHAS